MTAHCYSTRGWLAVDVFTCGDSDPRCVCTYTCTRDGAQCPVLERMLTDARTHLLSSLPQCAGRRDPQSHRTLRSCSEARAGTTSLQPPAALATLAALAALASPYRT